MSRKLLVGEAAERLGITASGVRWLVDTGRIRSVRTPRGVRLCSSRDVERLRRERQERGQAKETAGHTEDKREQRTRPLAEPS